MLYLKDNFGRKFPYLRLSITDVCNFRCTYCLPNGYKKTVGDPFLTIPEIKRIVLAFSELGTWKIRLTGGEPTLRTDFVDIARAISSIPGIRKLAFTTNGYKLRDNAKSYAEAGLAAVNISIDSLDPDTFFKITGHDRLSEVLEGVDAALGAGFSTVKINKVFLRGINHEALDDFLNLIKDKPVSVRLIELMQTGQNQTYFQNHHVSINEIRQHLIEKGWKETPRGEDAGPAIEFFHPNYKGRVGFIAPYSNGFCQTCNRLRVTSRGELRLCLFGHEGYPLRTLLQRDNQQSDLIKEINRLITFKKKKHFLEQGDPGITPHLASIGG